MILVKGTRRLVATVTAFTVAHSITLAAATLGFVHVQQKPVEACIALSIVFVASEIVHARQRPAGLDRALAVDRRVYLWPVAWIRFRRRVECSRPASDSNSSGLVVFQCWRRDRSASLYHGDLKYHGVCAMAQ